MKRYQAYKFQLRPSEAQKSALLQHAGCCRFVWNKALAFERENYELGGKYIGYNKMSKILTGWKKKEDMDFLNDAYTSTLHQSLMDLDKAYRNFFEKRAAFPRFKKKGQSESFVFPRGFKLNEGIDKVFLPKIGWIHYRNSRLIQGKIKSMTVSQRTSKWYVSILTEREGTEPMHPSKSVVGVDLGVALFATLSDGTMIKPVNSLKRFSAKLAKLQRDMAKKKKFSANWMKAKAKVQRVYSKIANVRNDFLHKTSTTICKNHAVVIVEDLKVSNMTRSASGTIEKPGKNVSAKSGLNKAILDQGWGEFRRQLTYKQAWRGGMIVVIPPQYTSQTCSSCGVVDKASRKTQALFRCTTCGYEANADVNAACNILAAGLAVTACGVGNGSSAHVEAGTMIR